MPLEHGSRTVLQRPRASRLVDIDACLLLDVADARKAHAESVNEATKLHDKQVAALNRKHESQLSKALSTLQNAIDGAEWYKEREETNATHANTVAGYDPSISPGNAQAASRHGLESPTAQRGQAYT